VVGWLDLTNSPDNTNTLFLSQSLIAPYLGSVEVWKCPGDRSTSRHGGKIYPRVRSYSMSSYINVTDHQETLSSPYQVFRKTSDLTRPGPSQTWVLIDERADSINNGLFALQWTDLDPVVPERTLFFNVMASYHNRAGSLNFADGHSEIKPWKDSRTYSGQFAISTGSPSPNNRDLVWLLERSTARK
jgi:hypothetical protein